MTRAQFLHKWATPGEATHAASIKKLFNGGRGQVLSKVTPAAGDAGVVVSNVTAVQQNAALPSKASPQTLNSDGLPLRNAQVRMTNGSPLVSNGSPIMPGADRSRTLAKPLTSAVDDRPFIPLDELGSGFGAIEHLQAHGVSVGIHNGVLTVARAYVPTAKNLIAQLGVRN